ncbi:WD40-repeat-containing domain protein [Earliella scabrosa]|nr:WD40-repeat-containing domain protein [Earliella scabrosa]
MSGWSSAYIELHTLTGGHSDTINSISFSPDGAHLASCADDQSVIVWNTEEGRLLYRVLFKSKVDRVIWHTASPATLIVGCDNGFLYQLHEFSPTGGDKVQIELGVRGTIYALCYDKHTRCLAVGVGCDVYITREVEPNHYEGACMFPPPPTQPDTRANLRNPGADHSNAPAPDRESRVRPVDLHFLRDGRQLLASYLAHGIVCWDTSTQSILWCFVPGGYSGSSAISSHHERPNVAVYNVLDGVDVYVVKSGGGHKRKPRHHFKLPKPPRTKHAVHITYINEGRGLVCGSTTGDVCVWDTATGDVYQTLLHDRGDILQAVCVREYSYVAAGCVDKGQSTYVKVWRAKYS